MILGEFMLLVSLLVLTCVICVGGIYVGGNADQHSSI